jgi:heterodisulfide reductase subunit A-like polyferredoxin
LSDQVWVVGEVLIDLIPDESKYVAVVGGGPANTAKALAKLGVKTHFIDGISNDEYGQMARLNFFQPMYYLITQSTQISQPVLQKLRYLHQEVLHMNL